MAEILSQDEVDALLSMIQTEEEVELETATERFTSRKTVVPYNFKRPDRISKDQMRFLQFIHDRFARNFSSVLSAYLRSIVEVNLVSIDQISYSEFLMSLPDPTCFCVVGIQPIEGKAAFEINPTLAFPMIDRLLGGPGEPLSEMRALTDLEVDILDGVIQRAMEELRFVWSEAMEEIEFVVEVKETSPHLIQIVSPNEVVVLVVFEVRIGEVQGMMNLCIPAIALEPISSNLSQEWFTGTREVSEEDRQRIVKHVLNAKVDLNAILGETKITVGEVLDMESGDLIRLPTPMHAQLKVKIGAEEIFKGVVGILRGIRAFKVEEVMVLEHHEEEEE